MLVKRVFKLRMHAERPDSGAGTASRPPPSTGQRTETDTKDVPDVASKHPHRMSIWRRSDSTHPGIRYFHSGQGRHRRKYAQQEEPSDDGIRRSWSFEFVDTEYDDVVQIEAVHFQPSEPMAQPIVEVAPITPETQPLLPEEPSTIVWPNFQPPPIIPQVRPNKHLRKRSISLITLPDVVPFVHSTSTSGLNFPGIEEEGPSDGTIYAAAKGMEGRYSLNKVIFPTMDLESDTLSYGLYAGKAAVFLRPIPPGTRHRPPERLLASRRIPTRSDPGAGPLPQARCGERKSLAQRDTYQADERSSETSSEISSDPSSLNPSSNTSLVS